MNKSLQEGIFPTPLKHSIVKPKINEKSGDTEDFKNYRPLSNTSFISKVIEKAVHNQINHYLTQNNLHTIYQSGYKKRHSCETGLLNIVNDMINDMIW